MADIETTLKTRTNQDNVFPNIHSANIPSGAVTEVKLADNSVTRYKIADLAVHGNHIDGSAITEGKIADYAVTARKLASSSVTHDKLAIDAIDTINIQDGAVIGDKIATSTIARNRLKYGQMTLHDLYVTSSHGDFINFIHGIESYIEAPFAKFVYKYRPDAHTVYTITPLYAHACTENTTTPNMGIKFVFTLPDGTNKTVEWLLSDSGTEPADLADIICEYFSL